MFGKKLQKEPVELKLTEEQFCAVWEGRSDDYSHEFCVDTNADQYNLFYRNGRYEGTPTPRGGSIYPFSMDPLQKGSRSDKKKISRAKVVCLSSSFNLSVKWGTQEPYLMYDGQTGKPYTVGARGLFYVEIDPGDGGRNADTFYRKLLSQVSPDKMDVEALRDKLAAAFLNRIGAEIQSCLEELKRPLGTLIGLQPGELTKISEAIYPRIKNIFDVYGLTIVEESSKGSILEKIFVNPVE